MIAEVKKWLSDSIWGNFLDKLPPIWFVSILVFLFDYWNAISTTYGTNLLLDCKSLSSLHYINWFSIDTLSVLDKSVNYSIFHELWQAVFHDFFLFYFLFLFKSVAKWMATWLCQDLFLHCEIWLVGINILFNSYDKDGSVYWWALITKLFVFLSSPWCLPVHRNTCFS